MRRRPFAILDTFRAALSSKRKLELKKGRQEETATTQQIGLESSDVSYIVVLVEIEGRLEVSRPGRAILLNPSN
jgi:hypothetical protein